MSELQAVTFDFWGTIFQWNEWSFGARREAIRDFVARHGSELPGEVVDEAFRAGIAAQTEAWKEARHFGPDAIIDHLLAALGIAAPAAARAELQRFIEDPDPSRVLTPIPGVADAIADLRARGIRLGVVCDAGLMVGRVLRGQLDRAGLLAHFEPGALAFSDEVGVTKPRPEMFMKALDAIGVAPSAAAHVGDLRFTDMAGARALGMRAVRFRGFNDDEGEGPEGDSVIDSYDQLPHALGLAARDQ